MGSEQQLSEFRIEISDAAVVSASRRQWRRMAEYIERRHEQINGAEINWWGRPAGDSWVYQGHGPSDVVTLLQAAARGDDLAKLLDHFEALDPQEASE